MASASQPVGYAAEIVPNRLYFVCMEHHISGVPPGVPQRSLCYWLDSDLIYEPFCADFGPCNLAHLWRFSQRVNRLLEEAKPQDRAVYLLVGPHPHKQANAAALVGIHSVLYLGKRAEEAYAPLRTLEPFAPFRDASCGPVTFPLRVKDVINGMARARDVGFIRWAEGEVFDIDEYEHYEQVENGDLNWIVPGKLMAFSGPSATPKHYGGWRTFTPEDYVTYFREKGVTRVVRLNKKMYESSRFTAHGVAHEELYFPDGTCPPYHIMRAFLHLAETEPGALAIHCKAGLGRTGVLICCYMIKHFGFTAEEAMGYIRVCRPGSVIGPQQHYLVQHAPRLLHEGRVERAAAAVTAGGDVVAAERSRVPAGATAGGGSRPLVNLVATSRQVDLGAAALTSDVRRSPRLSSHQADTVGPLGANVPILSKLQFDSIAAEPAYIVSVPGRTVHASLVGKAASNPPAMVKLRVDAAHGAATPTRPSPFAAMPSLHSSPALGRTGSGGASLNGSCTPPGAVRSQGSLIPPSSSKRMLAPNGQPRKIPMAMDLDQVDAAALEDRDSEEMFECESWPADMQTEEAGQPCAVTRVGGFAAAAGRSANAFVEAVRSVVSPHRSS